VNPLAEAFHQAEINFFSMMSINKVAYDNITVFVTGVPVSNLNPATLSTWENQARLDDIATMPSYQKQGHATSLIYTVLKKATQLNIRNCYLEASSSGLNVYKRIGFKPIFNNYY
jgi:ribosomal protein S18 acetylase RimI-like enzyme